MEKFVYPGSFDPITLGHVDIIKRASLFCDELIVAVLVNSEKKAVFSLSERVEMVKKSVADVKNVRVQEFEGLLADFVKVAGAKAIIKGLRAVSDYEYELQMAHINKKLNKEMETFFMMASVKYSYLSSSTVRDIARYGGDVSEFLPKEIIKDVIEKLRRK
jgi:pantetheine-phosphate adenylyltransferase